jgi:hypothetical protein
MASGQRPLATSIVIILFVLNLGLLPAKGEERPRFIDLICKPLGPIDCSPSCPKPKINLVHPFGVITNELGVMVEGCDFGSATGSLILPLKDYKGNPKQVAFQINSWQDNVTSATFSKSVSGVMDQPTTIQVVKHGGVEKSAPTDVNFQATKETKMLQPPDVVVSCSDEAAVDRCNGVLITGSLPLCLNVISPPSGVTISGAHYTCTDWMGSTDNGTDLYLAFLKNGWVFDHSVWQEAAHCDPPGVDSKVHPTLSGFVPGSTGMFASVDWIVCTHHGWVSYDLIVFITGPKGVPHK